MTTRDTQYLTDANIDSACCAGWDPELYTLDKNHVLEALSSLMAATPEHYRYHLASEIYLARKQQLSLIIDSLLVMPSRSNAKQLHETMLLWLSFLVDIPYLNARLLEDEIAVCENLCNRSRMGISPGARLVYTAYQTFNNKESYGSSFRKALQKRLENQKSHEEHALSIAIERAQQRKALYQQLGIQPEVAFDHQEEATSPTKDQLDSLKACLYQTKKDIEKIEGFSGKDLYRGQLSNLLRQLSNCKPYKIAQKREIRGRIKALESDIDSIAEKYAPTITPLQNEREWLEIYIKGIESSL